ncbi:hypothetical protein [Bacillus massiliigorillae]|uniref:hypothetical protein n=1 Tax=Bacillus massiliigorillae TaxID=1243664 RepID=UPI0003A8C29C|nr:hypothetical protein [Bacillus massiliigorillae]
MIKEVILERVTETLLVQKDIDKDVGEGGGVLIGLDEFTDLYTDNPTFKVSVLDDKTFKFLAVYLFTSEKYLSEGGLHNEWHNVVIPYLSKIYDCRKMFHNTFDLI